MTQANTSSGLLGTLDPALAGTISSNITSLQSYLPYTKIYIVAVTLMLVIITVASVLTAMHTRGA